jgi:cell division septal protein FtsQ
MRRGVGIVVLVTATMAIAVILPRLGQTISRLELFNVTEVKVQGVRYLAEEEVRHTAMVPVGASLWDDLAPIVERLEAHPGIRNASAERRFPGTLVVAIEEKEPVALAPNPTLTPVDVEGAFLPFDPSLARLDLPLLRATREGNGNAAALSPAQVRALTAELNHLGEIEPNLLASVSDVALDSWGHVVLHLEEPSVRLRYPSPLSPQRLREALIVLDDALARNPDRPPVEIDLRFAEQVVIRLPRAQER